MVILVVFKIFLVVKNFGNFDSNCLRSIHISLLPSKEKNIYFKDSSKRIKANHLDKESYHLNKNVSNMLRNLVINGFSYLGF